MQFYFRTWLDRSAKTAWLNSKQSQQHFMALDNFLLLRGCLEHSRTAETSAQKCSKWDNFNLKFSKILWVGAQPLPRPHLLESAFDLRYAPLRIGLPTSIFSNTPLPTARRMRQTARRIAVCGQGRLTPNYGWEINPQHLTRWGTLHLLRAEHEGTILYSSALCGLDTLMRLSESPQFIMRWLDK